MSYFNLATCAGKRKFIAWLCNTVRNDAMRAVANMPAEWDAHELREYVADSFDRERVTLGRKRAKSYRKAVSAMDAEDSL